MLQRMLTLAALYAALLATAPALAQDHAAGHGANPMAKPGTPPPATGTISFSGYTWKVKSSSGQVGPGPNYFSSSRSNVWVDAQGRLHLRITRQKGKWYSAEVVSALSFGHGTYRFYLDSSVDNLDPNVVLGLFTWHDDPAYNHREIDIEFARWGSAANLDAQYVVQPYDVASNIVRFDQPAGVTQSTHSFNWLPGSVEFESIKGLQPGAPNSAIRQWTWTGATPVAGGENARINLWLFQGHPPLNGSEVEVIINRFEFIPMMP